MKPGKFPEIPERVMKRQAELKARLKGWALIVTMCLLGAVSVGCIIWFMAAYFVPALSSGGDTIQRLGLVGAYDYYAEVFRKSVNSLEPVDRLFLQITIISLLMAWIVGSHLDRFGKDLQGQLDNLAEQLNEVKDNLASMRRP
ncbi:MAG TPA: hypothetical protein VMV15_05570 [Candidatus Binataceae bacterium]|nr:hypothetical protein [Candidatus Binataceae bacterium]